MPRILPNAITLARLLLVPVFGWSIVAGKAALAPSLLVALALSDWLDGFLARRYRAQSRLGTLLDPVADKLLLVSTFVTLTLTGLVPLWLAATAVARDLVIAIGAAAYRRLFGPLGGQPTWPSKANTLFQLAYVLAVVAGAAAPALVPGAVVVVLGATAFVTTVVSGRDYLSTYARRAAVSRARSAAAR